MPKKLHSQGFSTIGVIVLALAVAAISLAGWHIRRVNEQHNANKRSANTPSQTAVHKDDKKQVGPSENGKYLVIKEWGVKAELPEKLRGSISYKVQTATDPETNLPLQMASIYISAASLDSTVCAITETNVGASVQAGANYLRSDIAKSFNAARYKGDFQENILTDSAFAYHLNSITPDCLGGGANAMKIEELQHTLVQLVKVD